MHSIPPRRQRSPRTLLIGALAALALVAAACGNSSGQADGEPGDTKATDERPVSIDGVPGVTDDEIRFVAFGTRSNNPLGTCILDCYVDGINAYFAYRNSEGGVHGRDLVLAEVLDDKATENQVTALEITSANDAFGAFSAALLATGWADIATAGMPLYTWAINFPEMFGQESIYGNLAATCLSCIQRGSLYAPKLAGATRVAALGYGITQNSKDCVQSQSASLEQFGDELGMEMAYPNDALDYGLPNGIAPEVAAMKDAGVDFIITCIDLNGVKTLAAELARQGMGDVPMLHQNTYNAEFVAEAGGLFDGDYVLSRFRPFESEHNDALDRYFEWIEETDGEHSEVAMVGWINADLAFRGLEAAGPTFDRAAVIEATNTLTDYTADGLVHPIDWSRQHEPATDEDPASHGYKYECVTYVQVVDGSFELVGEADAPFFCWDNSDRSAWTEPESRSFE